LNAKISDPTSRINGTTNWRLPSFAEPFAGALVRGAHHPPPQLTSRAFDA